MKSAILIVAYNRPALLKRLVSSLESAVGFNRCPVVFVEQIHNSQVQKVINDYAKTNPFVTIVRVNGKDKSTTENISFNRLAGLRHCFYNLNCDYVVSLEDDVTVAVDILKFSEHIMEEYEGSRSFRGINFGSFDRYKKLKSGNYSKVRFGLHGPAFAIHMKTWKKLDSIRNRRRSKELLFDALFEYFIKTGFMISPQNSRFVDLGYGGSHTGNFNDPYFVKINCSFVRVKNFSRISYRSVKFDYSSFQGSMPYLRRENWKYWLIYFANYRNEHWLFKQIERGLYRTLILKKLRKVKLN